MAFGTGLSLPQTQGLPTPQDITNAYESWAPEPGEFLFRELMPDNNFEIPFVGWDVKGSPEGALNDNSMDSPPLLTPMRDLKSVALQPMFKDKLVSIRPTDAVNQRAAGSLNKIDPWQRIIDGMEEVAIAIEVQKELDRVSALTATLKPRIHGIDGATYSYPVQTYTPSTTWANAAATVVADINAMVSKLSGWGSDPTLYIPRAVALALVGNTQLITLLAGSVHATMLGPGGPGGVTIQDKQICEVLKIFTGLNNVVMYDKGYKTLNRSTGAYTWNPFMPQTKVLLVATPPKGQHLGFYGLCPTVNKGGYQNPQPGSFMNAYDYSAIKPNGTYDIHGGYSGAPAIVFPEAVVTSTVVF